MVGRNHQVHSLDMEVAVMGMADKMSNTADKAAGKVKETAGDKSDDKSLEAEGKGDQSKADLKQAGEKAKDAFKK